jgi:hypothetical protein
MPLLYGEGGIKRKGELKLIHVDVDVDVGYTNSCIAFYRLQEEIIRASSFADHSILTWMLCDGPPLGVSVTSDTSTPMPPRYQKLLSPPPYGFRNAHGNVRWDLPQSEMFSLTSRGLRLSMFVQTMPQTDTDSDSVTAILNCR